MRSAEFTPTSRILAFVFTLLCMAAPAQAQSAVEERLVQSYRAAYNVRFDEALKRSEEAKALAPADPMPWIAEANATLFREFDRLQLLRSETFASDDGFTSRKAYNWNASAYQAFQNALRTSELLASKRLEHDKNDERALLALALSNSMRAEDAALFAKKNMATLAYFKASIDYAQRLLAVAPERYDAYLASGLGKYVIGCKAAPVRWVLHAAGLKGDHEQAVKELSTAAAHAPYSAGFARLLLAFDDLRHNNRADARRKFVALHEEFPNNPLFLQETAKLDGPSVGPGQ